MAYRLRTIHGGREPSRAGKEMMDRMVTEPINKKYEENSAMFEQVSEDDLDGAFSVFDSDQNGEVRGHLGQCCVLTLRTMTLLAWCVMRLMALLAGCHDEIC